MADTIKVDVEKIRIYASNLRTMHDELSTAKDQLIKSMEEVEQGWKGEGSKKFHELLADDWAVSVERYCELLEVLVQIMEEAAQTYEGMETQIKALKYKE